ncbi:MAG: STAS/SEC14 domain-containing protein, partial [Candidatus Eremiobacteraeota bacterium]|nr:STAS/SEC14 domain-containing protein [Candidatus Eremiobacteraeota bacterium]
MLTERHYSLLERSHDNIMGIRLWGKLTRQDYEGFLPAIEALMQRYDKIRVFVDMTDFRGLTPSAAFEDLKFGLKHWHDVERMALVGEQKWAEHLLKLSKPIIGEARFFAPTRAEEAWQWLKSE